MTVKERRGEAAIEKMKVDSAEPAPPPSSLSFHGIIGRQYHSHLLVSPASFPGPSGSD